LRHPHDTATGETNSVTIRRIPLAVICALLLLTSLLSACSTGDDDDNTTSASPTAAVVEATAAPDEAEDADPTATEEEADSTATEAETEPTEEPAASPTATEEADDATPTETDTDTGGGDAATEAELAEVIEDTVEVRGLETLQEVEAQIISREQLGENLLESLDEDYPAEDAIEDVKVLWLLRLLDDPELDLHQLYVDLYSEAVLGYYDPAVDELFLVSNEEGLSGLTELTMSHELVHALQDQHYDLEAFRPEDLDADQATAVTALIEGDAESASTQYAINYMEPGEISEAVAESGDISSDVVNSAPVYIREGLYFPYVQGSAFVGQLIADGGFERVDAAYADPPTSTEQILHPEKYLGERDDPQAVTLPDLTGALSGWTTERDDTLGEWDLEIMLHESGAEESGEAAAGWGGGQWAFYESDSGDDTLVIMSTMWDTEADAEEFDTALRGALDSAGAAQDGIWDDGSGRFTAFVAGADGTLTYIASTDRAAVENALTALP